MELKNVKITKIGNKDKPSAYLLIKHKLFLKQGLSFDKTYNVEVTFTEANEDNNVLDVVEDDKEATQ